MKTKLLFLLLLISSYAFAQFPTDATKHYSFTNSDITNQAGTNYDLVLNSGYGTPTFVTDRFGNANSATDLNNGHFNMGVMPNRSGYDGNQLSLSFWIKSTTDGILFHQYDNVQENGWIIGLNGNSLFYKTGYYCSGGLSCGSFPDTQYISDTFLDDNWHHIVAIVGKENDGIDQQYIKQLYVDNVLVLDFVLTTVPFNGTQQVGMLHSNDTYNALTGGTTGNNRYDGLMDDIYYFERGITTAEVNALYNEGLVVDIPDANLKAALVSDATINTNSDSEIQPSEAINYTGVINVTNLNIDNSAGLEAFVNISGLDISNNNLEHLDVSSNTALTSLEANNNQLITLNIQNGNNSNISDANFNVLNNYGLYCIEVDDVSYSNTNWTNINAYTIFSLNCDTANVNIPDIALRTSLLNNTSINNNGDSEIQVAEARDYTVGLYLSTSGIQDITGLQAFANATNLDLSYNNVSIMDFRANRYLTGLHVGDNPLTSLNINGLSSITTLIISDTSLTDVDLSTHESLQYLEAQYVHNIANLDLSSNTNINYIYLSGNMLTNIDLRTGTNVSNNLFIETAGSPMLTCVFVDDPAFSLNNSMKDAITEFYQLDSECANFTLNTEDVVFQNNEISIYPNPTKSTINIKTESNVANVFVYSLLGKEVIKTNTKTVDVSSLSKGIYLIKIIDLEGNQHVKRFIKK
ncbi:T9SS type A sorting domain-containing protein [Psychroserpens damuponensis]|uniref:T9SS type A sorting domain-containing protein n=1 Tax=Psychroserpens damuponensis TaxID=943936 RepID=UPI00058FEF90|nr:T9SS type A sorting domain-containing protein [Psychroserpens damuponensis]